MNIEIMRCPKCGGTGVVFKKAWTQGPHIEGVHPAILAGRPAYRTIVEVPCDEPTCSARKR